MNKPLISVCCLTYNHKPYIRDAIEGFLMQETEYPYEIIIHDDASTDGTQDIIHEYADRNPEVFRASLQSENQFSKGVLICEKLLFPEARGKYIAMCEGDDCWIDPHKLQIQVSYMESHPECSMTFHAAEYETDGKLNWNEQYPIEECDVPLRDIFYGGGFYCPTASLVFRTEIIKEIPEFRTISKYIGDYPLQLLLASRGTVHFFPQRMCKYRYLAIGAYSTELNNNSSIQIRNTRNRVDIIRSFERWSEEKHPYEEALLMVQNYGTILGIGSRNDEKAVRDAFEVITAHIRQRNGMILALTNDDIPSTCEIALLLNAFRKKQGREIYVYVQRDYQKWLLRGCMAVDGLALGGPLIERIIPGVIDNNADIFMDLGINKTNEKCTIRQLMGLDESTPYERYQLQGRPHFQDDVNEDALPQELCIREGKTILFFPFNISEDRERNTSFWRSEFAKAREDGYDIIVNHPDKEYLGERTVYQRIDHTIKLAEYCGVVAGKSPVLTAINAFTDTRIKLVSDSELIMFYPENIY